MPYRFLEEVAIADVAFEAWGDTVEEMITAAAEATMNVMVEELDSIRPNVERVVEVGPDELEFAVFHFLQEIIFYKDAQRLLLRVDSVEAREMGDAISLRAVLKGEELDPSRHELIVDVKAVTLHRYRVGQSDRGWEAFIILDI